MTPKAPKFLHALYTLLHIESPTIISWSPCGNYFQVLDVARLERNVLPRYFKHSKFASFQRQLNNFGFRKWTKTRASVCTFSHDALVRCAPSELAQLVADCGIVSPHTKACAGKRSRSSSEAMDSGSESEVTLCDAKKFKTSDNEAEEEELLELLESVLVDSEDLTIEGFDVDKNELDLLLPQDQDQLLGICEDLFSDISVIDVDDWSRWSQCSL